MRIWRSGQYFISVNEESVYLEIPSIILLSSGKTISFEEFLSQKYSLIVKKNMNQRILKEAISAIKKKEAKQFQLGQNKVIITPAHVSIGEGDQFGGVGTNVDAGAFLSGLYHDFVLNHFDEGVLDEVIQWVKK